VVKARITESGLGLLSQLDQPIREMHWRALGHLGHERLSEFLQLLERAREPHDAEGATSGAEGL
jgi:hypothetical protein